MKIFCSWEFNFSSFKDFIPRPHLEISCTFKLASGKIMGMHVASVGKDLETDHS